jgi:cell division protein ZapA (FtsZ GTPase activity inhibitor)
VRIAGQEYVLTADLPEEYIHKVAIYVDKKMSEVSRRRSDLSTAMAAVMAAINIADEVMELRGEKEAFMKMEKARQQQAAQQPPQAQPAHTPVRSNIASFKEVKKG